MGGAGNEAKPPSRRGLSPSQFFPGGLRRPSRVQECRRNAVEQFDWSQVEEGDHFSFRYPWGRQVRKFVVLTEKEFHPSGLKLHCLETCVKSKKLVTRAYFANLIRDVEIADSDDHTARGLSFTSGPPIEESNDDGTVRCLSGGGGLQGTDCSANCHLSYPRKKEGSNMSGRSRRSTSPNPNHRSSSSHRCQASGSNEVVGAKSHLIKFSAVDRAKASLDIANKEDLGCW